MARLLNRPVPLRLAAATIAVAVFASMPVARQAEPTTGFAGASVSVRFADQVDAWAGAGLKFQDIVTQGMTATATASLAFHGVEGFSKAETASTSASVAFQNHTEFTPHWIEYTASPSLNLFFEQEPPEIASISPGSGMRGTTIAAFTVLGTNFHQGSLVGFSGTGVTVVSYSSRTSTEIVATVSIALDALLGARDVIVINPDLREATLAGAFQVVDSSPSPSDILVNISTGGSTFPQGATVPFGAIAYDPSDPETPLTSSFLRAVLTVADPSSAVVFGPTELSFNAVSGQFTGTLNTSGLPLGTYQATFTFQRLDGSLLASRSASFTLVSGLSLSIGTDRSNYSRGQNVEVSGRVQDPAGSPLAGVAIQLTFALGATTRQFTVFSNPQGDYSFVYTPPGTEAGTHVVSASALRGGAAAAVQATFVVHGLMLDPPSTSTAMTMNSAIQVPVSLRNIGETDLTAVTLVLQDLDATDGITGALGQASFPALASGASQVVLVAITAPAGTAPSFPAAFKVIANAEGGITDSASIVVSVRSSAGMPVVDPASASVGMTAGTARLLSFTLRNEALTSIAEPRVEIDEAAAPDWIVLQNEVPGSLAPGESKTFGVSLFPPADTPPGEYEVQFEVVTGLNTVRVPVTVEITSSLVRPVALQVSDDAAMDVAGASVRMVSTRLFGSGSGAQEAQTYDGTTDASGRLQLPAVAAGVYTLHIQAARHADYEAEVTIEAGTAPQQLEAILSTTVVNFSFKVTRTAIVDEYDVALVVTYSTDLIKPALIGSPALLNLAFFPGETFSGEISVANSHTQTSVTNVRIDASNLDLPAAEVALRFEDSGASFLSIPSIGPKTTQTYRFTASIKEGAAPASHALGAIEISGNYVYSLRGTAQNGTAESRILVSYIRPESLRMQPPVGFINDETGPQPAPLQYAGATTRITLENLRDASLDLLTLGGQSTSAPPVSAVLYALPTSVRWDQVPLSSLASATSIWNGSLDTSRLAGRGSVAGFDVAGLTEGMNAHRDAVLARPPYLAVGGRWNDGTSTQGFVFPVSITTLRPHEIVVVQSGEGAVCLACGGGTSGEPAVSAGAQSFNNHGIVKIQIDQKISVEREAFAAILGIAPAVASLENFSVTLSILDADGADASDRFTLIPTPPPSTIVEPTDAQWIIVPKVVAGGTTAQGLAYTAAAHISYSVHGVPATFDTAPETFTVLPLPKLRIDYTIPYVVMNNIPFNLDVKVTNIGAGPATNVSIVSAQPRIIENLNNLPIEFSIAGSSATSEEAGFEPGAMAIRFPTIAPGASAEGFWRMFVTRRGFIVDFTSTLTQRSINGAQLDPIVEVFLNYSRALGGRISAPAGCSLGPLTASLQGTTATTQTNAAGDYYLRNLTAGGYFLSIARPGGVGATISVNVLADQPTDFVDVEGDFLLDLDSDNDRMPDCWELANQFNPDDPSDASGDADGDGLTNLQEFQLGRDPHSTDPDSDRDGVPDDIDNCPTAVNSDQRDTDGNGVGDACDIAFQPDLAITKTIMDPNPGTPVVELATFGRNLSYEMRVENRGGVPALGVSLVDTLPSGVVLVSAPPSCNGTGLLMCDLGSLASGANATLIIVVRPQVIGEMTNTAVVTAANEPPDRLSDNTAIATTTVLPGILSPPGPKTLYGTLDPTRPTIVLTHGLSGEDDFLGAPNSLWTGNLPTQAKGLIGLAVNDVNVVQYVWPEAFQVVGPLPLQGEYVRGRDYTLDAGVRLARELLERLGPSYDQPIQFIGHSLGTVVNAYASWLFLSNRPGVRSAQVTALDRPDHVGRISEDPLDAQVDNEDLAFEKAFGFHSDFFAAVLNNVDPARSRDLTLVVDNYYAHKPARLSVTRSAGVGDIAYGTSSVLVYNHPQLKDPNDVGGLLFEEEAQRGIDNDHSGVHQWYRWTIVPNRVGAVYCDQDGAWQRPANFDLSLNPCRRGWHWSLFGARGPEGLQKPPDPGGFPAPFPDPDTQYASPAPISLALSDFRNVHGCQLLLSNGASTIRCLESSSAFGMATVDVPSDATYLSFEYRFPNLGDGDYAAVFLDEVPIWILSGSSALGAEFVQSGPLPIRGFGGHRSLTVALFGVGSVNAEVELRDFRVTAGNVRPAADAGEDQLIEATFPSGATVTLDASESSDPDGDTLSFTWTGPFGQLDGAAITPILPLGEHTITLTVADGKGSSATDTVVVTIRDTQSPAISISTPVKGAYTFGQSVAATYGCTDEGSGVAACAGPVPNGASIDTSSLGTKTFTVNGSDNVGNTSTLSVEYNVVVAPTTSTVTVTPNLQQYSDLATFVATLSPAALRGQRPAATVTFMVGSQALGTASLTQVDGALTATLANVRLREPTPFGTTPTDQMSPGAQTVTAVFGGVNPNFIVNDATTTLTIAKEDAVATYTGALFASTSCASCTTVTLTLGATVQDISAVPDSPLWDPSEGDIRHATVSFEIVETGQRFTGVPVGLVSSTDTWTGTATKNVTVDVGNADAMALTVRVIVDGYYTAPVEQTVVTVAKPLTSSFITGGGYLRMSQSAGLYSGQGGTKNNFGFNVKYNKKGTNLQGGINTLVRHDGRTYQIKGNAMTSLATDSEKRTATFNGKANIQDVTDPLNPISIDGNATLQVTMTDRGEPGMADTIGITVWNKSGGLWFSSSWDGTRTVEQSLAGGNLIVR